METKLPDFILAELYKDDLVIISSNLPKLDDKDNEFAASSFERNIAHEKYWLGNNESNICIIVADEKNNFLDEKVLEFLMNILKACKLSLENVAIVNIARTKSNYDEITNALQSKFVLLFGINEEEISLKERLNVYENKLINKISILKSPSFETLMQPTLEAKKEKGNLWTGLKKMFGL